MKQVQYIKTGLLSNLILILCICATWYSCNDDADQAAAAPEILFMNENLTVDLNKATNPPIVCVINAEAGLKSVQTFIQKTGGKRSCIVCQQIQLLLESNPGI